MPRVRSSKAPARPALSALARELRKRRPFDSPAQEAYLNIIRTAAVLANDAERLLRPHGLSASTYNVLRILRGAGDGGMACSQVGAQMVARVPDVTRLIDRLERSGLAERARTSADRRVVTTRITPAGLRLLAALDGPVLALHEAQLGHMPAKDLRALSDLLARARRAE